MNNHSEISLAIGMLSLVLAISLADVSCAINKLTTTNCSQSK